MCTPTFKVFNNYIDNRLLTYVMRTPIVKVFNNYIDNRLLYICNVYTNS